MAILSKAFIPDNFKLSNSLKLNFTNIWDLSLNIVGYKSFLESNSPDILTLCKTNLDDSIDSGNFSVRVYLPLIQKNSSTHMHCVTVYVKEGLLFARDLSLKTLQILTYVFDWVYITHCLTSTFSIDHLLCLWARFLILFHLTWMKFSQSTYLLMFLSLETLTSVIRTGLPILVELIDLVNCYWVLNRQVSRLIHSVFCHPPQPYSALPVY